MVILATSAAAISAEAKKILDVEEIRLKSLLNDYVTHRFAAFEEKVKHRILGDFHIRSAT